MALLQFIQSTWSHLPIINVQSLRGTRLYMVYDDLYTCVSRLSDRDLLAIVTLLYYGTDTEYSDVIDYCCDHNLSWLVPELGLGLPCACSIPLNKKFKGESQNNGDKADGVDSVPASTGMPQADTLGGKMSTEEAAGSKEVEATAGFLDNAARTTLNLLSETTDYTRSGEDYSVLSDLNHFLTRPVLIQSYEVGINTDFSDVFLPYKNYMSDNAVIKRKIENYQLFRCSGIRLEFRINGSPFHFGRFYAGIVLKSDPTSNGPLDNIPNWSPHNASLSVDTLDDAQPMITTLSQFPGIYLDPTTNESQVIDVPFVISGNYFNLLDELNDLATVHIFSINQLRTANDSTDPITINVFASIIDPVLAMPSKGDIFTGQSMRNSKPTKNRSNKVGKKNGKNNKSSKSNNNGNGGVKDEYGEGIISAPASALSDFAGTLEKVPVIGTFATATRIGAGAVSSIAKLFGYSRPISLETTNSTRLRPFGNLANSSGDDTIPKLSMDPKQEVSVDPGVLNLESIDHMSFAHLFKRESLLFTTTWSDSSSEGTTITNWAVHPQVHPIKFEIGATTGEHAYFNTALSWASKPFLYWRGTLHYRIQIVASQMHRGRIGLVYYPDSTGYTGSVTPEDTFVEVIDLAEARDVTFAVRWGQAEPFKRNVLPENGTSVYQTVTATTFPGSQESLNGALRLVVLNDLTSPGATDVDINVFISAGDDFMVAEPYGGNIAQLAYREEYTDAFFGESMMNPDFTSSCENEPTQQGCSAIVINGSEVYSCDNDNLPLVCFGEQNVSLRNFLKRYTLYWSPSPNPENTGGSSNLMYAWRLVNPYIPPGPGVPYGTNVSQGSFTSGDVNTYNYAFMSLIHYYTQGFACMRGAVRWKYILDYASKRGSDTPQGSIYVTNLPSSIRALTSTGGTLDVDQDSQCTNVTNNFNQADNVGPDLNTSEFRDAWMTHNMGQSIAGSEINYHQIGGGIEFERPFYYPRRCVFANQLTGQSSSSYLRENESISYGDLRHTVMIKSERINPEFVHCNIYTAAGEDFSLYWFQCAPVMFRYSGPTASGTIR